MNTTELIIFLPLYTLAASYVGWTLCAAAHKRTPTYTLPKCDDSCFEPRIQFLDGNSTKSVSTTAQPVSKIP